MNATEELSFRAVNEKRGATSAPAAPAAMAAPPAARLEVVTGEPAAPATGSKLPFDPWRLVAALWKNAPWIVLCGIICAAAGLGLGFLRFRNLYSASTSLIRQELPNTFQASESGESFKPKQLAVGTLVSVLRSPTLLKKVSAQTHPVVTPGMLAMKLTVTPERNTDVIRVEYEGWSSAEATANLLNVYGDAVVQLTRDLQSQEAAQVNKILLQQLAAIDADLAKVGESILTFSREAQLVSADKETDAYLRQLGDLSLKYETMRIDFETIDLKLESLQAELAKHNPAAAKLQEARAELNNLLVRYTEANPVVGEQRARVAALEKEMETAATQPVNDSQLAGSTAATSLYLELVEMRAQKQTLAQQLEKMGKVRDAVQEKLSALPEKSVQLARLRARQQSLETARTMLGSRQREAQMFADNAPGYYRVLAAPSVQDVATKSRWPKIILVTLALGAVGTAGGAGLVLGREILDDRIKTAHDLARLARLPVLLRLPALKTAASTETQQWAFRGWTAVSSQLRPGPGSMQVLGVTAAGEGEGRSTLIYQLARAAAQRGHHVIIVANREPEACELYQGTLRHPLAETLAEPRGLFPTSAAGGAWAHLLVEDPGWNWTRERRQQWQQALAAWRAVRSLVVLVELPACSDPETLLLAETIPNLLWLGSTASNAAAAKQQLEALRSSQCHVLGAAFNRRGATPGVAWLGKWAAAIILAGFSSLSAFAGSPTPAWQERLTLGPGDTVSVTAFGRPDSARPDITVGPDGKISYLEAHQITAAGLTIDELRAALDAELGKYYRNARTIVTPGVISSKRYYMLGKVVDKGAFTLDRPLTILEAVARSRGLETGLFQQNTVELADLPRAFLCRQGRRMPVDFERLFQKGDLSQNLPLEPEDYLYFPSANVNEVYVLGAVKSPGIQGFTPNASVISMVTVRGGFTEKAYLDKILVVRGSLTHPETFVVDARKILKGGAKNFALQPKDIVFVADKPWARAEELLDIAVRTFVQAAAAGWASESVGPIITAPIIPTLQ
jgi:protein involved in polysaccharide export with SLBB domain/uncharacterized protein involved in exopolysaccharide biosynthesis